MSLQDERIQALCAELRMAALGEAYPALAQEAARDGRSFSDFLEAALRAEQAETAYRRQTEGWSRRGPRAPTGAATEERR